MYIFGHLLIGIVTIVDSLLFIYSIILFGAVILTWVNADPRAPLSYWINRLSQPIFVWIRRRIPLPRSQMDLAPLIAIFAIMFIQAGVLPAIHQLATQLIH